VIYEFELVVQSDSVRVSPALPERFRGELLTVGRYTNPASRTFFEVFHNAAVYSGVEI